VSEGQWADTSVQRLGTTVSDDLQRYVDTNYRTNGHWSITGLSDGGYGAAYLASRTPGQYDSVCSMSGTFTADGPAFAGQTRQVLAADSPILHARAGGPRTLLIAGSADRDIVRAALVYTQALQRAGESVQTVVVPGGHTWQVWKSAFPRCLAFLLASSPPPTPPSRPACPVFRLAAAESCAPSQPAECVTRSRAAAVGRA
jgi:S-formylglutathione hydrolase FrmB